MKIRNQPPEDLIVPFQDGLLIWQDWMAESQDWLPQRVIWRGLTFNLNLICQAATPAFSVDLSHCWYKLCKLQMRDRMYYCNCTLEQVWRRGPHLSPHAFPWVCLLLQPSNLTVTSPTLQILPARLVPLFYIILKKKTQAGQTLRFPANRNLKTWLLVWLGNCSSLANPKEVKAQRDSSPLNWDI